MNCANHDQTPAIATCSQCGRALCEACAIHWQDKVICKACLEDVQEKKERRSLRKSPPLAALLSAMPGLGQVYVGAYVQGFIYILVVVMLIGILSTGVREPLSPILGTFLAFFWLFNMIDASRRATLYNEFMLGHRPGKPPTDSPLVGGIVLLVLGLVLTLGITFDMDLEFLEIYWPLLILLGGIYLLGKYVRTRRELDTKREDARRMPAGDPARRE